MSTLDALQTTLADEHADRGAGTRCGNCGTGPD